MSQTAENRNSEHLTMVKDVEKAIEMLVPAALQEDWDNSGLLIGFREKPVRRILTCLEIDQRVVEEAKEAAVDMIVTHHPLIFHSVKMLQDDDYKGRMILDLIAAGISVYSCHTPFDKVKGGNNDIVMERLGVTAVRNLAGQEIVSADKMMERKAEADIGRIGSFKEPMSCRDVIRLVASHLEMSIRQIHAAGSLDHMVQTIGVCTGAGADLAGMAAAAGCQLFITGDVKYHEAQDALQMGMCIIDAGHYGTEKFFAGEMKRLLEKKLGDAVEVMESAIDLDPFVVL